MFARKLLRLKLAHESGPTAGGLSFCFKGLSIIRFRKTVNSVPLTCVVPIAVREIDLIFKIFQVGVVAVHIFGCSIGDHFLISCQSCHNVTRMPFITACGLRHQFFILLGVCAVTLVKG